MEGELWLPRGAIPRRDVEVNEEQLDAELVDLPEEFEVIEPALPAEPSSSNSVLLSGERSLSCGSGKRVPCSFPKTAFGQALCSPNGCQCLFHAACFRLMHHHGIAERFATDPPFHWKSPNLEKIHGEGPGVVLPSRLSLPRQNVCLACWSSYTEVVLYSGEDLVASGMTLSRLTRNAQASEISYRFNKVAKVSLFDIGGSLVRASDFLLKRAETKRKEVEVSRQIRLEKRKLSHRSNVANLLGVGHRLGELPTQDLQEPVSEGLTTSSPLDDVAVSAVEDLEPFPSDLVEVASEPEMLAVVSVVTADVSKPKPVEECSEIVGQSIPLPVCTKKLHVCETCGRHVCDRDVRRRHRESHNPVRCPTCQTLFSRKASMNIHRRRFHSL